MMETILASRNRPFVRGGALLFFWKKVQMVYYENLGIEVFDLIGNVKSAVKTLH